MNKPYKLTFNFTRGTIDSDLLNPNLMVDTLPIGSTVAVTSIIAKIM